MRLRSTKEEFIADMSNTIAFRNTLNEFYVNVYLPMLCTKFDGKVYNKRLFTALNAEAKKIHEWLWVGEEYGEIVFKLRRNQYNYNDCESFMCRCVRTTDGRISYKLTINDTLNKAWAENFNKHTEEIKEAIAKYDEYMKIATETEEAIKRYNKMPNVFRNNIDTVNMIVY